MNVLNITGTMFIEKDLSYIRKKKVFKIDDFKSCFCQYLCYSKHYILGNVIFLSSSANYLI